MSNDKTSGEMIDVLEIRFGGKVIDLLDCDCGDNGKVEILLEKFGSATVDIDGDAFDITGASLSFQCHGCKSVLEVVSIEDETDHGEETN